MKTTVLLLAAALVAPVAIAFGASAALVSSLATGIGIASIALGDYGKANRAYHVAARTAANPVERHPLAA